MNLKTGLIFVLVVGQLALCLSFARAVEKQGGNLFSALPTAMMDDPRRIEWQKPAQVVDHLLIKKGDVVADVGAGTGYFYCCWAKKWAKAEWFLLWILTGIWLFMWRRRQKRGGLHNIRGIPRLCRRSQAAEKFSRSGIHVRHLCFYRKPAPISGLAA